MAKDAPKKDAARKEGKYPYNILRQCLKLGGIVAKHGGDSTGVPKSVIAEELGTSLSSSGFAAFVASAKTWGIVEGLSELSLGELGRQYFFPQSEEDPRQALLGFLVKPTAFAALVDQLDGNKLPSQSILANQLGKFDIPVSWRFRAAGMFLGAANELEVIDQNGYLRYGSAAHKAKGSSGRGSIGSADAHVPHAPPRSLAGQPTETTRQESARAALPAVTGTNVWVYSEAGGTVRLETPDPIPLPLWDRLNKYVTVLKPTEGAEGGLTHGSKFRAP